MRSTPLRRVFFPVIAVVVGSLVLSVYLQSRRHAPPPTPHVEARLIYRAADTILQVRIGGDGDVYVTDSAGGLLTVLSPEGSMLWQYALPENHGHFTVNSQGRVFVTAAPDRLLCVSRGKVIWDKHLFKPVDYVKHVGAKAYAIPVRFSDPVYANGLVYVAGENRLFAYSEAGERVLTYTCADEEIRLAEVCVASSGLICLRETSSRSTGQTTDWQAISPAGEKMWKLQLEYAKDLVADPLSEPAFVFESGKVTALDSGQRVQWSIPLDADIRSFSPDGFAFSTRGIGTGFIDKGGRLVWTQPESYEKLSADESGLVFAAELSSGLIYALDRTGGKRIWHTVVPGDEEGYRPLLVSLQAHGRRVYLEAGESLYTAGPQ